MEEKNNNLAFAGTISTGPKPSTADSGQTAPSSPAIKFPSSDNQFTSPFSPGGKIESTEPKGPIDLTSSNKSNSVTNDVLSTINTGASPGSKSEPVFAVKLETSKNSDPVEKIEPERKKNSGTFLFIIIALILMVASAAVAGVLVYSWQVSKIQPLQKEKSLLQSQVGNLKSQVDVLQKDKATLEADLSRMMEEAKNNPVSDNTTPAGTPTPVEGQTPAEAGNASVSQPVIPPGTPQPTPTAGTNNPANPSVVAPPQ